MTDKEDFDFGEAFLRANARRDIIVYEYADAIYEIMRALVSSDPSPWKVVEKLNFVTDLIKRCDEPITKADLVKDAIAVLRDKAAEHERDREYFAAEAGLQLFVEYLAGDGFAAARLSKRRRNLVDEARELSKPVTPESRRLAREMARRAKDLAAK